jgi:hypothetical protein
MEFRFVSEFTRKKESKKSTAECYDHSFCRNHSAQHQTATRARLGFNTTLSLSLSLSLFTYSHANQVSFVIPINFQLGVLHVPPHIDMPFFSTH